VVALRRTHLGPGLALSGWRLWLLAAQSVAVALVLKCRARSRNAAGKTARSPGSNRIVSPFVMSNFGAALNVTSAVQRDEGGGGLRGAVGVEPGFKGFGVRAAGAVLGAVGEFDDVFAVFDAG